jgi:hypothetical protein
MTDEMEESSDESLVEPPIIDLVRVSRNTIEYVDSISTIAQG